MINGLVEDNRPILTGAILFLVGMVFFWLGVELNSFNVFVSTCCFVVTLALWLFSCLCIGLSLLVCGVE